MDLFKQNNSKEATSMDFYDTAIVVQNTKLRAKDKKMLHRLSRSRIKMITKREIHIANLQY